MKVTLIEDGTKVEPNRVYAIPPNKDVAILNGALHLMDLPQPRGFNLPIDNFFKSLAQDQGANAICIILSGTGSDGSLGLKQIKGELGMGLGLAVVLGIVKTHGGAITADSLPGAGTTFTLIFPLSISPPAAKAVKLDGIPRGHERILLVDDKKFIIDLLQKILGRLGYGVKAECNPQKALSQFRSTPDAFDLVITDMAMPKITGDVLAVKLMEIRPDIPVIICTGHSSLIDEEKAKQLGIAGFVMKPASTSEMAKTIRQVLDKKNKKDAFFH